MPMQTLNVIQVLQLLLAYLGCTVGLPAVVFYPKTKNFPASARFLIYFTIGNFYVINLVQLLTLLHISCRATLLLFTVVPAALVIMRLYKPPLRAWAGNFRQECRHYVLRELGTRSFLRRRWREMRACLRAVGRQLLRLLQENAFDLPFLVLFTLLICRICGPGILNNWGYGASDLPVHNYWINGLIDNNLYIAGIYPMGMHCMLYYLSMLLAMPAYVALRLFWVVQYSMVALVLLAFLKGVCRSRFLPHLGALAYVGANYFRNLSYTRFGSTLPQEFGAMFILPSVYFIMSYFRARTYELDHGINRLRCVSGWLLLGFALSFSLTLSTHFYDTIIAGILCVGIVLGYGYWIWRREYLLPILLAGMISILLAFLPMAAAFLTGKSLQGSMYWAMNVIGLREYTVPIFRVICITVVVVTVGGILLAVRGIRTGRISLADKPIPTHSRPVRLLLQISNLAPLGAVAWAGWTYRRTLLWGSQTNAFALPNMQWMLYGFMAALAIGLLQRFLADKLGGAALLSVTASEILLGLLLVSGALGWPMLMEPYRVSIYFAYLIPAVAVMAADGACDLLCRPLPGRPQLQQALGLLLTALVLVGSMRVDWIRSSFGGGNLEMNEAMLCTANILNDNKGKNDTWTIVSANDELRMIEKYGRHTETIDFLQDMEYWNASKEILIPTERVYIYIEKQPLNYAGGYAGTIPPVSEEQAAQPLPTNSGLSAYTGTQRSVTMSRMYYWAQAFRELYPNEMKVYYENDRFVCYYIEQNVYRLYNFAIDYGYN